MARPERTTVDYFPFLCKEGKAMYYIENKYGNDGYATWVKILRELAVTSNHYLHLDNLQLMYLSTKCRISEEKLEMIISDLCKLGEFTEELWSEARVIWSEKFIEHIKDAYKKRNNKCITLSGLRTLLLDYGILKHGNSILEASGNTQSKVKKIKEKKSKEEKGGIFIPPTLTEVEAFFEGKGFSKEVAARAFDHYALAEPAWTDTSGKPVRSWKQKMNTVWCKEENKTAKVKPSSGTRPSPSSQNLGAAGELINEFLTEEN